MSTPMTTTAVEQASHMASKTRSDEVARLIQEGKDKMRRMKDRQGKTSRQPEALPTTPTTNTITKEENGAEASKPNPLQAMPVSKTYNTRASARASAGTLTQDFTATCSKGDVVVPTPKNINNGHKPDIGAMFRNGFVTAAAPPKNDSAPSKASVERGGSKEKMVRPKRNDSKGKAPIHATDSSSTPTRKPHRTQKQKSSSEPIIQHPKVIESIAALGEAIAKTGINKNGPLELYIPASAKEIKNLRDRVEGLEKQLGLANEKLNKMNMQATPIPTIHQPELDKLRGERDEFEKENGSLKRENELYKENEAAIKKAFNDSVMATLYTGTLPGYFPHSVKIISEQQEKIFNNGKKVKEMEEAAAKPVICKNCKSLESTVASLEGKVAKSERILKETTDEAIIQIFKKDNHWQKKMASEQERCKNSSSIANEIITGQKEEIVALHVDIDDLLKESESTKVALEREKKEKKVLKTAKQKLEIDIENKNREMQGTQTTFYQSCNAKARAFGSITYALWTLFILILELLCMFGIIIFLIPLNLILDDLLGWRKPQSPAKLNALRNARAATKPVKKVRFIVDPGV